MPRLSRRLYSISLYPPLQLNLDTQRFCYQIHPIDIEERDLVWNNTALKGVAGANHQRLEAIPALERPESDISVGKAK